MKNFSTSIAISFLFLATAVSSVTVRAQTAFPPKLSPIIDRLNSLKKVSVTYHVDQNFTPNLKLAEKLFGKDVAAQAIRGHRVSLNTFERCDNCLRYTRTISAEPQTSVSPKIPMQETAVLRDTAIYTPGKVEFMNGKKEGEIRAKDQLPEESYMDVALGLRRFNAEQLLQAEDFNTIATTQNEHGKLLLTSVDETGNKNIWVYNNNGDKIFLESYSLINPQGLVLKEIVIEKNKLLQNILIPDEITYRHFSYADPTQKWVIDSATIKSENVELKSESNTPDKYSMKWLKGTVIIDERTNKKIIVQSEDRYLSDQDLANIQQDIPIPSTPTIK